MNSLKRSIFWLEDDSNGVQDHIKSLKKKYQVETGASWSVIRKKRNHPIDLVIVDFMIHTLSYTEKEEEMKNIKFARIDWTETGLEFLKRLRQSEYVEFGFDAKGPVIVATAVVTYPARVRAKELGISSFLEKPFSIEELKKVVEKSLEL